MATPFFGKREPESSAGQLNPNRAGSQVLSGAYSGNASSASSQSGTSASVAPEKSQGAVVVLTPGVVKEGGSKLTVGPNIKLKGVEITDCDTLVVEGLVEATMDSRVIQIAEQGAFKGSAEIDFAEIRGVFTGNLTVRQKLVIFATGKVTGTIRYGKLVVEEGGQLSGEILVGFDTVAPAHVKSVTTSRPDLQAV